MKIIRYAAFICCIVQGYLWTSQQDVSRRNFLFLRSLSLMNTPKDNNNNNDIYMSPQASDNFLIHRNCRHDIPRDIPTDGWFDENDDQVQKFVGMHEPDNGNVGVVDDIIGHFYGNNQGGDQEYNTAQNDGGNMISDDQTENHSGHVVTEFVNILKTRPDFTLNKQGNSDRAQSEVVDRYRSSIEIHYVFNNDNVGEFAENFQDYNSLATVHNNENSQQNMGQDQEDPLNKQDQQLVIHCDQITSSNTLEEQVQTVASQDGDSEVGQGLRRENASVDSRAAKRLSPISNGEIRAGDTCSSMENGKNNNVVCKKSDRSLPEPKAKVFCGWC